MITTDSTCDLTKELLERFSIRVIPLTITLDGTSFPDDGSYTPADMYRRYRADGMLPTTSAPSLQSFLDTFSSISAEGYDIVHLSISSELSASCNTAQVAAKEQDGVYVVDSRMLSTGVALLAIDGAECAQRGMSAPEIANRLSALTERVDTSFVLDTLTYMKAGGRCSGVTAFGANLLHIKPALAMRDGKLGVYKKYRGDIRHVYREYITDRLNGKQVRPEHVFITESGEIPTTAVGELVALVRDLTGANEIHCTRAGCTVSAHCGPGTLGVLFINK